MTRICVQLYGSSLFAPSFSGHSSVKHIHMCNRCLKSYYDLLGTARNASQQDIKAAFYEKSKKYHPDTSNSERSNKEFLEITDAYQTLKNKDSRRQYDLFLGHTDHKSKTAHIYSQSTFRHHREGFEDFVNRQHFKNDTYEAEEEKFDPKSLIYLGLFCLLIAYIVYFEKERRKSKVSKYVTKYIPVHQYMGDKQRIRWVEQPSKLTAKPKKPEPPPPSDPPQNPIADLKTWK